MKTKHFEDLIYKVDEVIKIMKDFGWLLSKPSNTSQFYYSVIDEKIISE